MCVKGVIRERLSMSLAISRVLRVTPPQLQAVLEICTARHAHLSHRLRSITLCVEQPVGQTPAHRQQAATVCATKVTPETMQILLHSALRESTKTQLVASLAPPVSMANI